MLENDHQPDQNLLEELARLRSRLAELTQENTILKQEKNKHDAAAEQLAISERMRLEYDLREERERFEATLASIGDAVIATDLAGKVIFLNQVAASLTGWAQKDAFGKDLHDIFKIINEHTRKTVESPVTKVLRENMVVGLANHTLLIHKDGHEIPIDDSGSPIRNSNGQVVGVVLVFRDVTERKHLEDNQNFLVKASSLLASSLDYQANLKNLARMIVPFMADICVIYLLHGDGELASVALVTADPQKEALLAEIQKRYSVDPNAVGPRAVLNSGKSQLVNDVHDLRNQAAAIDQEHLALLKALGSKSIIIVPLRVRDQLLGTIGLSLTSSDRHYSQQDLELAEELAIRAAFAVDNARLYEAERNAHKEAQIAQYRLKFLAEASSALATSLDYETTLQNVAHQVVPQLADWCSVSILDEKGASHQLAVAHVDPAKLKWAYEINERYPPDPYAPGLWRSGQSEIYREIPDELLVKSAQDAEHLKLIRQVGFTSAMNVPLVAREKVLGLISFVYAESGNRYGPDDLTLAEDLARRAAIAIDNARLYYQAQKAIAFRDEFLSIAAHELKTPLTSLRGYAQMLIRQMQKKGTADPERLIISLKAIDQQSNKLALLISRLLDISRLQGGRLSIEHELIDVAALVKHVISAAVNNTDIHSISLDTPDLLEAQLDPVRFEQVVTNLVDNAIKYSPHGGTIKVVLASPDPATLTLSVCDQGLGIAPEARKGIFDLFYQAHGDTYGGMGIGLYISRQIVELHGGKIEVTFPSDGGTCFLVTVPLSSSSSESNNRTINAPLT